MGSHSMPITAASPEVQRWFDQGLIWAYAFNHDEAIRCFQKAAELDAGCAMAHWGIALCNGPHINNPAMDEGRSKAAWAALQEASRRAEGCSPVEKKLIKALAARYADPAAGKLPLAPQERVALDQAYADAMARVFAEFPKHNDVATLYAEALMDLHPWNLWDESGKPLAHTPKIVSVLETAMALDLNNPGANHLYVHAMEASDQPHKADAAADRLRKLVPASSHLVHMPAHIDVRTGRWELSAEQNRQASKVDAAYRRLSPQQDFYRVYMAHNDHFLAYAAMMLGRRQEAIDSARAVTAKIPRDWALRNAMIVDSYAPIELEVMLRFGLWDQILQTPEPESHLRITRAIWRFVRASAYAAKGQVAEATKEQALFEAAFKAVPPEAMMAINPAHKVLSIARHTLEGEIAFRQKRMDLAVSELNKAVSIEDTLTYMEPPDWVQPSRHALGAILLSAGRAAEAERVYREDLKRWPENGWSLYGLSQSLEAQGSPQAAEYKARHLKAWKTADTKIAATCMCVKK